MITKKNYAGRIIGIETKGGQKYNGRVISSKDVGVEIFDNNKKEVVALSYGEISAINCGKLSQ